MNLYEFREIEFYWFQIYIVMESYCISNQMLKIYKDASRD